MPCKTPPLRLLAGVGVVVALVAIIECTQTESVPVRVAGAVCGIIGICLFGACRRAMTLQRKIEDLEAQIAQRPAPHVETSTDPTETPISRILTDGRQHLAEAKGERS